MLHLVAAVLCITTLAPPGDAPEIFRIRIENSTGGRVQVSTDEGKTYATVGRVRRHAVANYLGFNAAAYVPAGTVAATAVHGIRLKVGEAGSGKSLKPVTISIVPAEFDETPSGYGGHIPYGSGIYTTIPAGAAIFRNFAPFAGSPFAVERGGAPVDLRRGWQPAKGDVIVIRSLLPHPYLCKLEFENRTGGAVTATYEDGREVRIATVRRPVKGVGRFDGTSYTGVGLINTNHGGVLTVSTAPISNRDRSGRDVPTYREGHGRERRGGFQIQPSAHARTQYAAPQAMVIEPAGREPLEGRPPIFSGFIGLAFDPSDPKSSFRTEVCVRGGPWQPMPELVGRLDDALAARGVDRIRILFPRCDREFLARSLAEAKKRALSGEKVVRGTVMLRPSRRPDAGSIVTFALDGRLLSATSQPPYEYAWDTSQAGNGEHEIEIKVVDALGQAVRTETRRLVVQNP